jgi:hypothetical protein
MACLGHGLLRRGPSRSGGALQRPGIIAKSQQCPSICNGFPAEKPLWGFYRSCTPAMLYIRRSGAPRVRSGLGNGARIINGGTNETR